MTHRPFLLAGTAAATALVSVTAVALPQTQVSAFAPANGAVFINEIHYDNSGTDTGEAIEIAGPAGSSATRAGSRRRTGQQSESPPPTSASWRTDRDP